MTSSGESGGVYVESCSRQHSLKRVQYISTSHVLLKPQGGIILDECQALVASGVSAQAYMYMTCVIAAKC